MKTYRHKPFLGVLIFLCVFALSGWVVMLLWNALLPAIISVSAITYLQSLGIIILSRLLFGGLGHLGKHAMEHFAMSHHSEKKDFLEMHHKFRGMSHQERAEFIRKRMCDPGDGEK